MVRRTVGSFVLAAGLSPSVAVVAQSQCGRGHDAASDDAARCDVAQSAKSAAVGTYALAASDRFSGETTNVDGVRSEPSIRHSLSGADDLL
jgi:hypothetical protein